ncbi:hypothetical protein RND81_08G056100 [Saponaria officinalis]|uniref:Uncharacterized protein n=1 Tax=Saponaria officinalis TaxID=3572 RepID=A0AAW1J3P3_SAPOF
MKGSSKVIMGATMAMVIVLVFVLALVLVLLAELYCSLLLRRRKLNASKPASLSENISISTPHQTQGMLSSFYAQGVLDAPRSFLFPKPPRERENRVGFDDVEKVQLHGKLHEFLRVQSPHQLGLPSSSPSPSYISLIRSQIEPEPKPKPEIEPELDSDIEACHGCKRENLMYISNPIYDNEAARTSRVDTPFETPDSSPSRMGRTESGSSGDEKEMEMGNPSSLPLTPMKELPTKSRSVVSRDVPRSLGNSISDSNNTHSHVDRSSSSSSETPCTSPSW